MEVRIAIHRHSETEMLATIFLPIISYLSWLSLLLVSAGITGKSLHRRMKSWVRGKEGDGGEGWEREMGNFFVGHISWVSATRFELSCGRVVGGTGTFRVFCLPSASAARLSSDCTVVGHFCWAWSVSVLRSQLLCWLPSFRVRSFFGYSVSWFLGRIVYK